jgi:tRNA (cytidine/uridine-2'-O-)-methyltransferase
MSEFKTPNICFYQPCIPGNTGSAMRLCAATGAKLYLVEPLGFDLEEAKLKRAGLDYKDLAAFEVVTDFDEFVQSYQAENPGAKIYAFTSHTDTIYTEIEYQENDLLLFGPEPTGLSQLILGAPYIENSIRIPMIEGIRSLNLANSASIGLYEVIRQLN